MSIKKIFLLPVRKVFYIPFIVVGTIIEWLCDLDISWVGAFRKAQGIQSRRQFAYGNDIKPPKMTNIERLKLWHEEQKAGGLLDVHVSWGQLAKDKTEEELAGILLDVLKSKRPTGRYSEWEPFSLPRQKEKGE